MQKCAHKRGERHTHRRPRCVSRFTSEGSPFGPSSCTVPSSRRAPAGPPPDRYGSRRRTPRDHRPIPIQGGSHGPARATDPAEQTLSLSFARRSKAISEEIACIRENYLWCSDFTCMNDPMEGFYRPSSGLKKKSDYDQILQRITSSKIALGISCFSDTRENILLWTHYAGNYSGICVAYSPSVLVDGLPGNASLIRLGYDDNPPLISSGVGKNVEAAARIILSQKKYNWAYEREWRVLAPKGRVCLERENPVKAVYLG